MYDSTEIFYETELFPNQVFKNLKAIKNCFYYQFFLETAIHKSSLENAVLNLFPRFAQKTSVQEFLSCMPTKNHLLSDCYYIF